MLAAAGCGAHYRGGALSDVDPAAMVGTGVDVTWDFETDRGPDWPGEENGRPNPREDIVKEMFAESGVFASVTRATAGTCHIHVIDRSWWKRSGWELASIFVSIVTLGIVPGYTRDHYDLEFRVRTESGEKSYRYVDYVKTWWGIWGVFFPHDAFFVVVPGGGDETWGERPDAAVLANIVHTFLADFARDYGPARR